MSDIVFVRHAETDFAGTFCGHFDPPLNEVGKNQLAQLVERTEFENIVAVYSSDLQRAYATAHALAVRHNVAVTADADLREIGFGAWEGLRWQQIEEADPAFARRWWQDFPHLTCPGGEPYAAFCKRALAKVRTLRALPAPRIAVVTHAGVLRLVLELFGDFREEDSWQLTRQYGSSFVLLADDTVKVCR